MAARLMMMAIMALMLVVVSWQVARQRKGAIQYTIRGGLEPILELLYYRYLRVDLSSRFTVAYLTGGGRQGIS